MLFHAERVHQLLEFFLDAAFLAAENVLDRLLGERGAALAEVPLANVPCHGARETVEAESAVVPVAGVFGGHQRVDDVHRDVSVGHVHAVVRVEEGAEQLVAVIKIDAGLSAEHLEDGVAVELVVGILFGEDLEHDDVCGDAANEADQGERCGNFQRFFKNSHFGCGCKRNLPKSRIFWASTLEKNVKIK